jgi:glycosyltransferase involved in cell wall biosynthesis
MRLNWFSPLLPERTDIAHYTARLAPALMRRFDVVFWTDLRADAQALPAGANIQIFDAKCVEERAINRQLLCGLNVYNFGNDARFHAGIFQVAHRIPGLVVLHDTRLHGFVFELYRHAEPGWAGYLDLARELYGKGGEARARQIVACEGRTIEESAEDMPFVEAMVNNAIAAVCHTKTAGIDIRARSDVPILTLALPFVSLSERPNVSREWAPPWRFVMFGYLNSNRRLESVIRALSGLRDQLDFRLDIFGTLWDQPLIEAMIARSGLSSCVTVHGFVPEKNLDEAIASAHLAFNLRYPTMGEASGGILRNWAHATPALVTNVGWYADLPDQVALKVSIENEIADIRRGVLMLAERPRDFETMGMAARVWLSQAHSPDAYVEGFGEALTDLPRLMTRYAGRRMLQRVAAASRSTAERRVMLDRAVEIILPLFKRNKTPEQSDII